MARKSNGTVRSGKSRSGLTSMPKDPGAQEQWLQNRAESLLQGAQTVGSYLTVEVGGQVVSANHANIFDEIVAKLRELTGIRRQLPGIPATQVPVGV